MCKKTPSRNIEHDSTYLATSTERTETKTARTPTRYTINPRTRNPTKNMTIKRKTIQSWANKSRNTKTKYKKERQLTQQTQGLPTIWEQLGYTTWNTNTQKWTCQIDECGKECEKQQNLTKHQSKNMNKYGNTCRDTKLHVYTATGNTQTLRTF